ncbi:MAG TPA: ABC transporter ATP-binding protein [Actinomycetota bacterium]|nr:ABC transporter ATP-binding protein [Actinomycetota bacterium]
MTVGGVTAPPGAAVTAVGLRKVYGQGATSVVALDGVDVTLRRGELTAIMGPSGSGKSTLLHCLAGLEPATSGKVRVGGVDITGLRDDEVTRLRRDHIGFVFQAFNLVPTLSALENITLPLELAGREPDRELLAAVVTALGLQDRLHHKPAQLSGGEQQRVACARALVPRPEIVFADEPTGNLDSRSGGEVLRFLRRAVGELGQTIAMVTHDPIAAAHAGRVLFLTDGRIVDELAGPTAERVLERMKRLDARTR